jgi:hypothetical protein
MDAIKVVATVVKVSPSVLLGEATMVSSIPLICPCRRRSVLPDRRPGATIQVLASRKQIVRIPGKSFQFDGAAAAQAAMTAFGASEMLSIGPGDGLALTRVRHIAFLCIRAIGR